MVENLIKGITVIHVKGETNVKIKHLLVLFFAVTVAVAGCAKGQKTEMKQKTEEEQQTREKAHKLTEDEIKIGDQFTLVNFSSEILENTLTGENEKQELCIYLPPSYQDSERSYPVVYYLHGFSESEASFVMNQKKALDKVFTDGAKEFILVSINGTTKAGGSFYVNSSVSGNWEDYIIQEVIPTVDLNFRTLADRGSRGLCGFSMGGFGAVNLSFKHPDIFSSFLVIAPGLFADGGLPSAMESWKNDTGVLESYAQAFSPDTENKEIYGNIPEMDGTPEDEEIVKDWESGYGNIRRKVEEYLSLGIPLKAMEIIYGDMDTYTWIPEGCEFLSECLADREIEHSLVMIEGSGHSIPLDIAKTYLVPFFNENLDYE